MVNYQKGKKAFTLLELLIVMGIIAILASAIVIAINPAKHFEQARNSKRWSDIDAISSATYSYMVDHEGFWPDCLTGSDCDASTPVTVDPIDCESALVPDYINAIPTDPQVKTSGVTGYLMCISSANGNRLKVYVDTTNTEIKDDVSGISLLH